MSDIPASSSPCHAGRWRAATIACLLVIAIGFAAGASMYEQFKAQVAHLQTQLKANPRIKYIAVLLDECRDVRLLFPVDAADERDAELGKVDRPHHHARITRWVRIVATQRENATENVDVKPSPLPDRVLANHARDVVDFS